MKKNYFLNNLNRKISMFIKIMLQVCASLFLVVISTTTVKATHTLTSSEVVVTDGIIKSCSYNFADTNIIIPSVLDGQTVIGIGESVFKSKNITSVQFPSTLEVIEDFAFDTNPLTAVDFTGCSSLEDIGRYAFVRCISITNINFNSCSSLKTIQEGAFWRGSISNLTINCPALIKIERAAFGNCGLSSVNLSACTALIWIEKDAFNNNPSLTSFTLPANTSPNFNYWLDNTGTHHANGATATDLSSFYIAKVDYTLTDDDVVVVDGKIKSCSYDFSRSSIIIPNRLDGQDVLGIDAWFWNKGLVAVTLPSTLKTIKHGSFSDNNIFELNLDACPMLELIGDNAFLNNYISSIDISSSSKLVEIGRDAFANNTITNFNLPATCSVAGYNGWLDDASNSYSAGATVSDLNKKYMADVPYVIKDDDVQMRSSGLLYSCNYNFFLKRIIIPNVLKGIEVKEIRNGAFYNKDITSVELPTTLEIIQGGSFMKNKLPNIDLSACVNLKYIYSDAFTDNILTELILPQCTFNNFLDWRDRSYNVFEGGDTVRDLIVTYIARKSYTLVDDDVVVTDGVIVSSKSTYDIKQIIIPETLDGQTVIGIESGTSTGVFTHKAFHFVKLPSTIEFIGKNSFYSNSLDKVDFTDCVLLHTIDENAFYGNEISKIDFSHLTELKEIGQSAFIYSSISSLDLSSNLKLETIGIRAFNNNKITSVLLSNLTKLTVIGSYAFANNSGLSSFVLPTPEITDYIFNYWENTAGTQYAGGATVNTFNTAYTANMTGIFDITFSVTINANPTQGASVTFNSETKNTNSAGEAVFIDVHEGTSVAYEIIYTGYDTVNSTIDVDANKTVSAALTAQALANSVSITHDGTPQFGETLTANITDITNNTGTLAYQWKRGGSNITGANASTYVLAAADVGATLTVELSSSIQTGSLESIVTPTIAKADAPAAPTAPTLASKTANSITLTADNTYEYKKGLDSWQTSNVYNGLEQVHEYVFYQRIAQTATHLASEASEFVKITTDPEVLDGSVSILNDGSPQFGEEQTAYTGVITNNTGTLSYQWKRNDIDISGATNSKYTLVQADIGATITLEVTSSVQLGSLVSDPTKVVNKAKQTTPAAPIEASKTANSIVLTTVAGCEYAIDGGTWQTSTIFNGLTQVTQYSFTQRKKETATHNASEVSSALTATTNAEALAGTVAITNDGTPQYGEELTADVTGIINNTGTLSYKWKRGTSEISGATSASYILVQADIGQTIKVEVASSVQTGSLESAATATVAKANQTSPAAPTVASKTANSIVLTTVAGCEYAIGGGTWQTSTTFNGLTQVTEYSFTQRLTETATHFASEISEIRTETTIAEDLAGTIAITHDGTPQFGETLTADVSGITNNTGSLEYYWKRNGATISGAFLSTYTLVEADINKTIVVEVTSSVQTNNLASVASPVVAKANQNTPAAPTVAVKTANSINLDVVAGCEYAIDGLWQQGAEFTGLNQVTEYTLTQRLAETATHNVSNESAALLVTTNAEALAGTVAITNDGTPQYGEELTADVTGITNNTGTLSYKWKRGTSDISGATSASYTLVQADIGQTIKVEVASSVQTGSLVSEATAIIEKADQSTPAAPTYASITHSTITLNTVSGCEYTIDGGAWQSEVEFTGLNQLTDYSFTQRMVETEIHNTSPISSSQIITTTAAPLAGTVAITDDGTPQFGEELTADVSGITNNTGVLSYIWKRGVVSINGATSSAYTLVQADIDAVISVEVSSNVQTGSLTSGATAAVEKADVTTVPNAPTLSSKTYNSITLVELGGYEYSINGTSWQSSAEFTALTDNTSYNLYQRVAETATHNVSAISLALQVTTDVAPANALTGTVTVSGVLQFGQELIVSVTGSNNTGALSYQWKRNGYAISSATNVSYTLVQDDIATNITVEVSSSAEVGNISSEATAIIEKADQNAPSAPAIAGKTETTVSITEVNGYEYLISGGSWQTSGNFSGLYAYTDYEFYQRIAETETHKASPASIALNVTTLANMLTGTATITNDGSPQFGEELSAVLTGHNNTGELAYQWKRGGSDIGGATQSTYTLNIDDIGLAVSVDISSSIERGAVESSQTAVVEKANQDAPSAPLLADSTHNTITLQAVSGCEYRMNSGAWQNDVLFTGLEVSTVYTFTQRFAASDTNYVSAISDATSFSTAATPLEGVVTLINDGTPQFGEELSADVSGITNNTGELSFAWRRSGNIIDNAKTGSYLLTIDDIGETISVEVRSSVESGSIESEPTVEVGKADGAESPAAPNLLGKTTNSVTLVAINGNEYSKDSLTWQLENEFTGLNASTAYKFYQRIAETATHLASVSSNSLTVTTDSDDPEVYSVTFNVTSQLKSGVLASIVFNSIEYLTNQTGQLVIDDVEPGTYDYRVFAAGFIDKTGEITVIDGNVVEDVVLDVEILTYSVMFKVTDGNNIVEGATVNLTGYGDKLTDNNGKVEFESVATALDIEYTVTADNFNQANGTVSIIDANITENIELVSASTGLYDEFSYEIKAYPNPVVDKLKLSFDKQFTGYVQLINIDGKVVISKKITNMYESIIDMSSLNQGMYLMLINNNAFKTYKKIVKK